MRILVVKLSSLGDLFHALPAVHCLKTGLDATIDWVTQTEYVDMVKCFTDVDRVIPFYRSGILQNRKDFLQQLREYEYDCVIDLQGLLKSAVTTRLARSGRRIGPSFHRECSRLFYTEISGKRDKNRHAVEENLDVIRHLDLEVHSPEFPVSFPETKADAPSPRVALVPVSRWYTKNWPQSSFLRLAQLLREKAGASIFLVGSPQDVAVCNKIEKELESDNVHNLAGKTSLVEMGSLISKMDLVVSNDSGPMHIAAAVDIPVLVTVGATDPKRTGPYGPGHRFAQLNLPCQPCFSRTCKFGEPICLEDLSPDSVATMAMEILNTQRSEV